MKPCLLCGRTDNPPSKEDVVPRWVRRAFGLTGPVSVEASEPGDEVGRRVHQRAHLTLPLRRAICRPCNNERLAPLERAVAPILSPMMINATPVKLSRAAQAVLATWGFKTALLLERAVRAHYAAHRDVQGYESSEVELAWLWSHREPCPRSRVWIGAFDAQNRINLRHGACLLTAYGRDTAELTSHLTTFTCGYVAFQVFSIDFVQADRIGVQPFPDPPTGLARVFKPLWPIRHDELAWPPGQAFGVRHWDKVCTWPRLGNPSG